MLEVDEIVKFSCGAASATVVLLAKNEQKWLVKVVSCSEKECFTGGCLANDRVVSLSEDNLTEIV